jgi:DNA-binding HxlR family transcriptional regulator
VLNVRLKELNAAGFIERSAEGYEATAMGRRVYEQLVPLGITAREWANSLRAS